MGKSRSKKVAKRKNRNKKARAKRKEGVEMAEEHGVIIILRKDFKQLIDYSMYLKDGVIEKYSDTDTAKTAKDLRPYAISIWNTVRVEDIDPGHIMTIVKISDENDREKCNNLMKKTGSYTIGVSGQLFQVIDLAGKQIKEQQ